MYQNTRGDQDRAIEKARDHGAEAQEHVDNLISIIEELDSNLTDALVRNKELEGELTDSQNEVSRLQREVDRLETDLASRE